MSVRALVAAGFAAALLGACERPQVPPPVESSEAPAPSAPQEPVEPLDPFVVMIGAERWGVLIDKAYQGAIEAPYANNALNDDDRLRTDRAVKSGAAELIKLRNMICAKGLLSGADCELGSWPAWVMEQPVGDLSWEELDARSEWLSIQMDRFTAVGCEAGRTASGDRQFCDVE